MSDMSHHRHRFNPSLHPPSNSVYVGIDTICDPSHLVAYLPQPYNRYGIPDHQAWRDRHDRMYPILTAHLFSRGIESLGRLGLTPDRIPNLEDQEILYPDQFKRGGNEIPNNRIPGLNGRKDLEWRFGSVPGVLPFRIFCLALEQKIVPVSIVVPDQIKDGGWPLIDTFHDLLGNGALAGDSTLGDSLMVLAHSYLGASCDEERTRLQRFYWHTFARGLISEGGKIKLFGAHFANNETLCRWALSAGSSAGPTLTPFDKSTVEARDFSIGELPDEFFILEHPDQIRDAVLRRPSL